MVGWSGSRGWQGVEYGEQGVEAGEKVVGDGLRREGGSDGGGSEGRWGKWGLGVVGGGQRWKERGKGTRTE